MPPVTWRRVLVVLGVLATLLAVVLTVSARRGPAPEPPPAAPPSTVSDQEGDSCDRPGEVTTDADGNQLVCTVR